MNEKLTLSASGEECTLSVSSENTDTQTQIHIQKVNNL